MHLGVSENALTSLVVLRKYVEKVKLFMSKIALTADLVDPMRSNLTLDISSDLQDTF